jgi:hypothetical protein
MIDMTNRPPAAGDLWTVPSLGGEALVILLTEPRVLPGGIEFEAVPAYTHQLLPSGWTAQDFHVGASETSLGIDVRAAFWNLHPVLEAHLGKRVAHVTSDIAFEQMLDAYIGVIGAPVTVPEERWGSVLWDVEVYRHLSPEIRRWREISCEVLSIGDMGAYEFCEMFSSAERLAVFDTKEFEALQYNILHGDTPIPAPRVVAWGPDRVFFQQNLNFGMQLATESWGFVMHGFPIVAGAMLWKPLTKSRYLETAPVRVRLKEAVALVDRSKAANSDMALCA